MMPSEGCINIVVILYTYHCIVAWRPIGEKKQMQRGHTHNHLVQFYSVDY